MGKDPQRFALVVPVLEFGDQIFGLLAVSEHKHRSFLDGPFKVMVADFLVGFAGPLAIGLLDRSHQPGIGAKVLHPGKTPDVVNFIEHDQGQDLAYTRDGAQQIKGEIIVLLSKPSFPALQ